MARVGPLLHGVPLVSAPPARSTTSAPSGAAPAAEPVRTALDLGVDSRVYPPTMTSMTVSEVGRRTGTTADTVRYYERIGLLPPPARSPAGYRLYDDVAIERVAFVKRAQRFGLQLDEIGELLAIRDRGMCPCGHARRALTDKLEELDVQMEALTRLREDIQHLLDEDAGPDASGCWPCGGQLVQLEPRPGGRT